MSDLRSRDLDETLRRTRTTGTARLVGRDAGRPILLHPERTAPLRLDLGCGVSKTHGFTGLDRFDLPGVDMVCDLDRGVPLADNVVDEVIFSHSLEHFRDLIGTMKEVWRVCKDRALVTLISPYFNTRLNQANPYHVQPLNEHTARFLTLAHEALVDIREYDFPHAEIWGLGSSDNSSWVEDFRVLKQEFFYLPAYRGLDEAAKRLLRQSLADVCDQFVVRLLVVKSPIGEEELRARAERTEFRDTAPLRMRRAEETRIGRPNAFGHLAELPDRLAEAAEASRRLAAFEIEVGAAVRGLEPLRAQVGELQAAAADALRAGRRAAALTDRVEALEDSAREVRRAERRVEALIAAVDELSEAPQRLAALEHHAAHASEAMLRWMEDQGRTATLVDQTAALTEAQAHTAAMLERLEAAAGAAVQAEPLYDQLNARVRAIHAEAERRALALEARIAAEPRAREAAIEAAVGAEAAARQAGFAADRAPKPDPLEPLRKRLAADEARVERALARMVEVEIARDRDAARWVRWPRRWIRRGRDLGPLLAGGPFVEARRPGETIQLERFWRAGDVDELPILLEGSRIAGLELAAWAVMPPAETTAVLNVTLVDGAGAPLASGVLEVNPDLERGVARVRFSNPVSAGGRCLLRLSGRSEVAALGLKLYERRRLQPFTRRVRSRTLVHRPLHA